MIIPCFAFFVNCSRELSENDFQIKYCSRRINAIYYRKNTGFFARYGRREHDERTIGAAPAAQNSGRRLRPAASAGTGQGVPPYHRERAYPQYDLLWPIRHGQDHRGPHHCRKQRYDAAQAERHILRHRGHQGGAQGHRYAGGSGRHPAVSGRDPVSEQKAAAEPAGMH